MINTLTTTVEADTYTCTACGQDVAEDLAVLLLCCEEEHLCPGCDDGGEQTCESCWQSDQRSMVGFIR